MNHSSNPIFNLSNQPLIVLSGLQRYVSFLIQQHF
ncbi:MAG: hypothetical protein ACI837_002374 [Crocinitomicaceae bacterium]